MKDIQDIHIPSAAEMRDISRQRIAELTEQRDVLLETCKEIVAMFEQMGIARKNKANDGSLLGRVLAAIEKAEGVAK